ncbi:CopG family transcriptional regulator, partial [Acidianus sp. RZ1]|uniref:CopG family transcriptional regulator n=1 Tax=Acidianus sp. RZ1 TaxID=1540082 RepID=UPI001492EFAB
YVRYKLFSTTNESKSASLGEEDLRRLERKIQDLINPFTAEIENLKQRVAQLTEDIEELKNSERPREQVFQKSYPKYEKQEEEKKERKTVMDILREKKVIYESELGKLRNPDQFFDKIQNSGGQVIPTEKERIAIDPSFYKEFVKKLGEIHTSDEVEAQKFLSPVEYKLFQKLRTVGGIVFDGISRS